MARASSLSTTNLLVGCSFRRCQAFDNGYQCLFDCFRSGICPLVLVVMIFDIPAFILGTYSVVNLGNENRKDGSTFMILSGAFALVHLVVGIYIVVKMREDRKQHVEETFNPTTALMAVNDMESGATKESINYKMFASAKTKTKRIGGVEGNTTPSAMSSYNKAAVLFVIITFVWALWQCQNALDWWSSMIYRQDNALPLYMNSSSAYALLLESTKQGVDAIDYFLLQRGFDAQLYQTYCSVATVAAIINSFHDSVNLPVDSNYDPYPYATQSNILNNCTNEYVIHKNESYDGLLAAPYGLGISQTKDLLKCNLDSSVFDVTAYHLDPSIIPIEKFRQDVKKAIENPLGRAIINYDRKSVGQIGGGHWSPIGAYSRHADSFLIMDVAKYKYPNAWIPTAKLYASLQTFDQCGDWNFPDAQDALNETLLYPEIDSEYTEAMSTLGCQQARRGYITIFKKYL